MQKSFSKFWDIEELSDKILKPLIFFSGIYCKAPPIWQKSNNDLLSININNCNISGVIFFFVKGHRPHTPLLPQYETLSTQTNIRYCQARQKV